MHKLSVRIQKISQATYSTKVILLFAHHTYWNGSKVKLYKCFFQDELRKVIRSQCIKKLLYGNTRLVCLDLTEKGLVIFLKFHNILHQNYLSYKPRSTIHRESFTYFSHSFQSTGRIHSEFYLLIPGIFSPAALTYVYDKRFNCAYVCLELSVIQLNDTLYKINEKLAICASRKSKALMKLRIRVY